MRIGLGENIMNRHILVRIGAGFPLVAFAGIRSKIRLFVAIIPGVCVCVCVTGLVFDRSDFAHSPYVGFRGSNRFDRYREFRSFHHDNVGGRHRHGRRWLRFRWL
jgi:hypothetical protein